MEMMISNAEDEMTGVRKVLTAGSGGNSPTWTMSVERKQEFYQSDFSV